MSFLPGPGGAFLFGTIPTKENKGLQECKILDRVGGDGSLLTLFKYLLLLYYRKANVYVLGNPATKSVLYERCQFKSLTLDERRGREREERERERDWYTPTYTISLNYLRIK